MDSKIEYVKEVGKALVKEHGTQKTYSINQVRLVNKSINSDETMLYLALATFCSKPSYDEYNLLMGDMPEYNDVRLDLYGEKAIQKEEKKEEEDSPWQILGDIVGGFLEIITGIG